jgi:multidrug efflux pump subunit AcrA (membrane-fusion protein)
VSFVAAALDRERQTLLVKATFANPDGALRHNQRVCATLEYAVRRSLAIPEQAVLLQAGRTFVFLAVTPAEAERQLGRKLGPPVADDSKVALQVPVELGALPGGAYAVRSGLQPRDAVILGNLAQLRSGLPVRVAGRSGP